MKKEERFKVLKEIAQNDNKSLEEVISEIIMDELKYAGAKACCQNLDIKEEFKKVINLYSFDGIVFSSKVKAYIKHCLNNPEVAALQHYELNDAISRIGSYYDGESTNKFSKINE